MNKGGIRLLPAFLSVGSWTLVSRVLGLARDIIMAALLGTGPVAQAFLIAFTLPNMFRRFFAEGAFNLAFVPMFAKKVEAGEDAQSFARDALSGLGFVLLLFTILGQIAMPWLVLAMASGFAGDERFALSVEHGRIAFPYILLISLTALLSGVLNSLGRFALPAAAPILMNVVMIAFLLVGWQTHGNIGLWQIWSVPVAGLAQLALVWWGCAKAGMPVLPRWPRLTPDMRRLTVIMVPALLAGGVVQINLLVGRQVGSFFDGAVAWLSYADRLYQLPLGVVGIAIGIVLLPDLSRRLKSGDGSGGRDAINRATELTLALTLPAAVALMVIPVPIVAVLFQRGAFTADDTWPTALAVAVYGAGLPAFVMQKVHLAALLRPRGHPQPVPLRRPRHGGQRRPRPRPRAFHRLHRRRPRHHHRRLGDDVAALVRHPADGRRRRHRRPPSADRTAHRPLLPDHGRRPPRRRPPARRPPRRPAAPLPRAGAARRHRHGQLHGRGLRHRRHAPRRPPRRHAPTTLSRASGLTGAGRLTRSYF